VKIVLAHPSYGAVDPHISKALRVAIMSASRHHEWIGDVSAIRQGWVGARNQAVKDTLAEAGECDGIVWVDDDVLLPPTAITRLLSYGKDFVTGIVYQKFGDYNPLVARWAGKGFQWWREFPENVLAPADGCGFGCCYTSTKMLRAIAELPPKAPKGESYFRPDGWFHQFPAEWFGRRETDEEVPMSEDFSFCVRAKVAGYQLYADTGLMCPHMIGPKFSTQTNHKNHWAKKEANATGSAA
jgi:GT2 family glycosyltransferase